MIGRMKTYSFFVHFAFTLLLTGCMSLHPRSEPPPHSEWVAKGHILLQTNKKSERAHLHWYQQAENTHLSLIGPLGSGRIELTITPTGTRLSRSDGSQEYAATPEALIAQLHYWPVPVTPATQWIRGLADSEATHKHWNLDGTLKSFESHGWQIQYKSYTTQEPHYPTNMTFKRAEWSVTVSIYQWGTAS